ESRNRRPPVPAADSHIPPRSRRRGREERMKPSRPFGRLRGGIFEGEIMKRLFIVLLIMLAAAAGLIMRRNEAAGVTFTKDVAPIVFNKCANCHRLGEVAPMPLTSYAETRPWSKAIREEVVGRSMPPWYADPHTSTLKFSNDRRLSQKESDTIV